MFKLATSLFEATSRITVYAFFSCLATSDKCRYASNETVVNPKVKQPLLEKANLKDEFSLEARIYDKIWGQSDYKTDVKFLDELFQQHHCRSVIDIGCGTGNHALRLSKMGYEVIGIDISPAMLEIAKEKDAKAKVKFIQGDMKKVDRVLPHDRKFDAAFCLGVAFSHLRTNKDVRTFLNGLRKTLRKGGLFVFDARNARKIGEEYLNKLLLEHIVTEDRLQLLFLGYNTRHPRSRSIIVWRPICLMNENGKVDLQIREHKLRWFRFSSLKKLLSENGFEAVGHYSGPTKEEFNEDNHSTMWFVTVTK
jgi:ubiquinone/menaquinone biosynthesis C-methylase UbiE